MTKDEVIYHLTWVKDLSGMIGMVPIGAETRKAIDAAISALRELDKRKALRQPQPDPETGLVPCGCGGKVAIAKYPGFLDTPDLYQVDCFECFVGTKPTMSPEKARIAWNRSMGWKGGAE